MSVARAVAWINIRHGWRTFFWAALLAFFAAALNLLPLFNVLGFDFAFAIGLVASLAAVDIGHGTVAAARRCNRTASVVQLSAEAVLVSLAVLVPPLLISLANAIRVRNCSVAAGLAFYALLPVATSIFAAGIGAALAVILPGRKGRLAALAVPFLSIGWSLVRLYRDPAVFAFDPFAGYFPGPIYDEALRPPLRLLLYRVATLTWVFTAVAAVQWLCRDRDRPLHVSLRPFRGLATPWFRPVVVVLLLACSTAWFAAGGKLGFRTSKADLASLLSRQTRSPHFVVYTDPAAESDADVAQVMDDVEFLYFELAQTLEAEPATPITVYRFPSSAAKKDAVGAATTLFAKPWTREVFVQTDRFPARRLRHELAHVFASAFGDPVFGVSLAWHFFGPIPIPRLASGLVEGVAEAADFDNPDGRSTTHEEAAAMLVLGKAPPLRSAIGAGFTFESGPRAYTIVGSFCRFLWDRFGAGKLRTLYRSAGDFERSYGRDFASLEAEWRAFLASLDVKDSLAEAEEAFRRPPIFGKVCARELAARVAEARTRASSTPDQAVSLLASVCADDPSEPLFRLDLAEAEVAARQGSRALETLDAMPAAALTRPLRGRAASLRAGIYFRDHAIDKARAALEEALAVAADDADERSARAKLRAIDDAEAQATLGRALFGDDAGRPLEPGLFVYLIIEFAFANPSNALGPYLLGRQLATRDPKLAIPELERACPASVRTAAPEPPPTQDRGLDPVFRKECHRLLGESQYLVGNWDAADLAFADIYQRASRESDRLRAQNFRRRIAWRRSR